MIRLFPSALALAVVSSAAGAYQGWRLPEASFKIVDIVASVSAILVGVSLAIVAIIASPTAVVSDRRSKVAAEISGRNDIDLVGQQLFIFVGFFLCLVSSVVLKYVGSLQHVDWTRLGEKTLSATFLGSLCYSLVLALFLPVLLRGIVSARRTYM